MRSRVKAGGRVRAGNKAKIRAEARARIRAGTTARNGAGTRARVKAHAYACRTPQDTLEQHIFTW